MPILGIDASRAVKKYKTGVEWYSHFLLRAMEKTTPPDWEVRCYAPSWESAKVRIEESPDNPHWKRKALQWAGRGWTQGRLSLEMMKSPPDVLFVPSHVIPFVHPQLTVTTVHDAVFARYPELYGTKDLDAQKRGLDFAIKFAKKIIVPSRATQASVTAAGGKPSQIEVIPHGVDLEYSEDGMPARRSLNPTPSEPYLFFVGRIERKKNVMGLIHAFRRLNDSSLKLILAGSPGYGAEDIALAIKTFKLQDRVIQSGWIDRARYTDLLRHAAILVLPSMGEGFGFPVLEAMAAGVPVVCSDIPALREIGGNAVQYINPCDFKDIARGIEAVLKNRMLQSEMERRGKDIAEEYTWQKSAKETWRVIESL